MASGLWTLDYRLRTSQLDNQPRYIYTCTVQEADDSILPIHHRGVTMKKMLIGVVAVFVTIEVLDGIIHGGILMSTYMAMQGVWRADMMAKMWVLHVVKLITAFFFTLIFSKGYEGKGIMEGVRYGCYMGAIIAAGFALGSYATFPIPHMLAIEWFFLTLVEYIIVGVVIALVYGRKEAPAPKA